VCVCVCVCALGSAGGLAVGADGCPGGEGRGGPGGSRTAFATPRHAAQTPSQRRPGGRLRLYQGQDGEHSFILLQI